MKKLSQIVLAATLVLSSTFTFAQSTSDDANKVMLTAYVPPQIDGMPVEARLSLENKLNQMVTASGLAGGFKNARFIITANVTMNSKNILPGPPPMHAYGLDVTLYIGDGVEGTVFATHNMTVKGVDKNETKAYKAALKNLKTNDAGVKSFIENGKNKIIEYYKNNCDMIIKEAKVMADQNNHEGALYKLAAVPSACGECYDKAMAAAKPIYQDMIDRDCKEKLQKAQAIWNAAQDMAAADEAGAILASVDPDAKCYAEVKALSNKIAAKVKQIDDREWKYILKEQQQKSEMIKAIRDIGVAYGNGPKSNVTYKSLW
ncbi:MAG: hypothetical protein KDD41_08545 [Flavobacteriales bacterium]|nr:hypothetical protein [Flavobacteriales bacterium]